MSVVLELNDYPVKWKRWKPGYYRGELGRLDDTFTLVVRRADGYRDRWAWCVVDATTWVPHARGTEGPLYRAKRAAHVNLMMLLTP